MRRMKLVIAVAAAMGAMMAFAGPAFASTDSGCISMPMSPIAAATGPTIFVALLLQVAVVAAIAVVAAVAQTPAPTIRRPALAGATQGAS